MGLLYKDAKVPEKEEDIQSFLTEIADFLMNSSSNCVATGEFNLDIIEPEAKEDEWEVKVSGQISDGQDNDGNEIWKQTELQDDYFGKTLKDAVEHFFSDVKLHYGDMLP